MPPEGGVGVRVEGKLGHSDIGIRKNVHILTRRQDPSKEGEVGEAGGASSFQRGGRGEGRRGRQVASGLQLGGPFPQMLSPAVTTYMHSCRVVQD